MIDATNLVLKFCDCARSTWNNYLYHPNSSWDEQWLFAQAEVLLFKAIVLHPLGRGGEMLQPDYSSPIVPVPFLHVEPHGQATVLVNREIDSGYWDWGHPLPPVEPGDFALRFIHFFDFGLLEPRCYEWVRVVIVDSQRYPEARGKHALAKLGQVRFLCEPVS